MGVIYDYPLDGTMPFVLSGKYDSTHWLPVDPKPPKKRKLSQIVLLSHSRRERRKRAAELRREKHA